MLKTTLLYSCRHRIETAYLVKLYEENAEHFNFLVTFHFREEMFELNIQSAKIID